MSDKPLRVLSLGAGVQSSALAMMMTVGEIESVDFAIFADTHSEPKAVYHYLKWLKENIGFPLVTVCKDGGLTKAIEAACSGITIRVSTPPLFTDPAGKLFRQCTWDYKVTPIRKYVRPLAKDRGCVMIRGISIDEMQRATPSDVKWATHEHPLIDLRMSRHDCIKWMVRHGFPIPPRSACVYCPYRCNTEWRKMRDLAPDDWAEACRVDDLMRDGLPNVKTKTYIHRTLLPLRDVDLDDDVDKGQMLLGEGWGDCEGMCGV